MEPIYRRSVETPIVGVEQVTVGDWHPWAEPDDAVIGWTTDTDGPGGDSW